MDAEEEDEEEGEDAPACHSKSQMLGVNGSSVRRECKQSCIQGGAKKWKPFISSGKKKFSALQEGTRRRSSEKTLFNESGILCEEAVGGCSREFSRVLGLRCCHRRHIFLFQT